MLPSGKLSANGATVDISMWSEASLRRNLVSKETKGNECKVKCDRLIGTLR